MGRVLCAFSKLTTKCRRRVCAPSNCPSRRRRASFCAPRPGVAVAGSRVMRLAHFGAAIGRQIRRAGRSAGCSGGQPDGTIPTARAEQAVRSVAGPKGTCNRPLGKVGPIVGGRP